MTNRQKFKEVIELFPKIEKNIIAGRANLNGGSRFYGKCLSDDSKRKQWNRSVNYLDGYLIKFDEKIDQYYTPNLFVEYRQNRINENVLALTSLWQDIDNCSVEDALKALARSKLPKPTLIVSSGGGVHMYWIFNQTYYAKQYGYSWYRLGKAFAEKLQKYVPKRATVDVSVLEPTRYLRVPGTYNQKRNTWSEIVEINETNKYELAELFSQYVPKMSTKKELPTTTEESSPHIILPSNTSRNYNNYNRQIKQDLRTLLDIRGIVKEGYRNKWVMVLSRAGFTQEEIFSIRDRYFKGRYRDNEIMAVLNTPRKHLKRTTILEWLEINESEQLVLEQLATEQVKEIRNSSIAQFDELIKGTQAMNEKVERHLKEWAFTLYSIKTPKMAVTKRAELFGIDRRTYSKYMRKRWRDVYLAKEQNKFELTEGYLNLILQAIKDLKKILANQTAMTFKQKEVYSDKLAEINSELEEIRQYMDNYLDLEPKLVDVTEAQEIVSELLELVA